MERCQPYLLTGRDVGCILQDLPCIKQITYIIESVNSMNWHKVRHIDNVEHIVCAILTYAALIEPVLQNS